MADKPVCTVVSFNTETSTAQIETTLKINDSGLTVTDTLNSNKGYDSVPPFGVYYITCIIFSIVTYLLDIALASYLAYLYFEKGSLVCFVFTVILIAVPNLISTAFSMRWYLIDEDDPTLGKPTTTRWIIRIIFLMLQMGQVLRYFDTLVYGVRILISDKMDVRNKLSRKMLDEDTDSSLLRLFHCFLHAAPLALMNLTILFRHSFLDEKSNSLNNHIAFMQCITVFSWMVSLAWGLTSYHRAVRSSREDKEKLAVPGTFLQFCWHFTSAVSRILALSLLGSLFPVWLGTVCLTHWLVMAAWLALGNQQTAVCANRCEELAFSGALGLAYVVAFIAPRDGPTRYSYLAYYLVCFMENTGALVVWCVMNNSASNPLLYYGAVIAQLVAFLLGLGSMLIYYMYFHPSGTSKTLSKSVNFTVVPSEVNKPGYSKNL